MSRLLLAVDVGNTHTTLGLYRGEALCGRWRLATRVTCTSDELWMLLHQLLAASNLTTDGLEALSVASVVPELTRAYRRMASERLGVHPLIITCTEVRSLRIQYNPPQAVGADRLCGAVAGFTRWGGPLIVVDLGTATVFDVVSAEGVYMGGVIAPGLETAMESLHRAAALLPRTDLHFPESVVGADTETAMRSGVLFGAVDMIDGIVDRIQRVLPTPAHVIATGGFAELIRPQSRTIAVVEPDLVIEGIRLITEQQ